jgi:predicted NBD/HSP70 family sugar kinase
VVEAGDLILNSIIKEAKKRSFQNCFDSTKIVTAALGRDGVAIGAALLARDS